MLTVRLTVAALCGVLFFAIPALAEDDGDHERAREALAAGRVLPFEAIVDLARRDVAGDILDVDLEDGQDGRFVYALKVLGPRGRVMKLAYDGATGDRLRPFGHQR